MENIINIKNLLEKLGGKFLNHENLTHNFWNTTFNDCYWSN